MGRAKALSLLREWTDEELRFVYWDTRAKAQRVADAYTIVLETDYIVVPGDTGKFGVERGQS